MERMGFHFVPVAGGNVETGLVVYMTAAQHQLLGVGPSSEVVVTIGEQTVLAHVAQTTHNLAGFVGLSQGLREQFEGVVFKDFTIFVSTIEEE